MMTSSCNLVLFQYNFKTRLRSISYTAHAYFWSFMRQSISAFALFFAGLVTLGAPACAQDAGDISMSSVQPSQRGTGATSLPSGNIIQGDHFADQGDCGGLPQANNNAYSTR